MTRRADALIGGLLAGTTLAAIAAELTGPLGARWGVAAVGEALVAVLILVLSLYVSGARRIFVVVGAILVVLAIATRSDWIDAIDAALASAAFITAFFAALTSLRHAAATSEAIAACGRFLAEQRPGRRYAALTLGGQLFGLILGYAAVTLLGGLAADGAKGEPDDARRERRTRRMLLAVQRGFVSTLPWSPLAFAVAISTSLIPGASWGASVWPCLVNGVILVAVGYALDQFDKPTPQPGVAPPTFNPQGSWLLLWPLVTLLGALGISVAAIQSVSDLRTISIVMMVAPAIALLWIGLQNLGCRPIHAAIRGGGTYLARELPQFRTEILLLAMAGFIGTLGAILLKPYVEAAAIDPATIAPEAVLLTLVWLIPIAGQIGMNPILITSLIAPLLPEAAALGIPPAAYIVAITAGWAISGASSPFTATTLLVGAIGGVSATRVGAVWNGAYSLICGALLSGWVLVFLSL